MQFVIYFSALLHSVNSSPNPHENTSFTSNATIRNDISEAESTGNKNEDKITTKCNFSYVKIKKYEKTLHKISENLEKHLNSDPVSAKESLTVSEKDLKILLEILTEVYFMLEKKKTQYQMLPEYLFPEVIEPFFVNILKLHKAFKSREKFQEWNSFFIKFYENCLQIASKGFLVVQNEEFLDALEGLRNVISNKSEEIQKVVHDVEKTESHSYNDPIKNLNEQCSSNLKDLIDSYDLLCEVKHNISNLIKESLAFAKSNPSMLENDSTTDQTQSDLNNLFLNTKEVLFAFLCAEFAEFFYTSKEEKNDPVLEITDLLLNLNSSGFGKELQEEKVIKKEIIFDYKVTKILDKINGFTHEKIVENTQLLTELVKNAFTVCQEFQLFEKVYDDFCKLSEKTQIAFSYLNESMKVKESIIRLKFILIKKHFPADFEHNMKENINLISILSPIRDQLQFYANHQNLWISTTMRFLLSSRLCPLLSEFLKSDINKSEDYQNIEDIKDENDEKISNIFFACNSSSDGNLCEYFENSIEEIVQLLENNLSLKESTKIKSLIGPETNFSFLASFFSYSDMLKIRNYYSITVTEKQEQAENIIFDEEKNYNKIKQILLNLYSCLETNIPITSENMALFC
ncbi:hypothetical protein EDEG_04018 [Edhazardia aedis USNM 41457]|uniref:Uncharacterized protein n=1 Tax=Edhazardia aedis (strain USNM 41457) TaxID=1003232 RepID=J8ZNR8_EDHAE|nr:hypothetical protein EDEG_04018 [Edhazardia aedis USNM 41457]|eukprot:EJW01333.1 hypothetical protein EDEG_04018 [Edhazardia aedis USNM 41457]